MGVIGRGAREARNPRAAEFALAIDALRGELTASHQREVETQARADAAVADRRAADAKADRAEERAEALRGTIDEIKAGQALMTEMHARELAAARHDAQTALQATATAEARATRAEQGEEAERARADTINALLEATHEELASQRALTDQARAEVQATQNAAAALRQADEARKARGRLRRAWDGWRGR